MSHEDETRSPWLGEPSSCWIGVAYGRDFSRLLVVADVRFCSAGSRTAPPPPKMKDEENLMGYLY